MRPLRALGAALVLAGVMLAVTSTATAQTLPPLVTDYANYPDTPEAMLTPGCDFTGVSGTMFSVNGSAPVGNLGELPEFQAGDVVTMTWTGVVDACVGSAISLVVKIPTEPFFDASVDQPTGEGGYTVGTLTAGLGSLSFTMPDLTPFDRECDYQMDAVVGVPLKVVGPNGSFFSANLRGDNRRTTLLSARNSRYEVCVAHTSQTIAVAPTTTTALTTTTSETPASTTTEPTAASPTSAAQSAQAVLQTQRTLAATGATRTTPWAAFAGIFAVGLGALLLVAGGRRHLAHTDRSSRSS
jgi:hypothetical protein